MATLSDAYRELAAALAQQFSEKAQTVVQVYYQVCPLFSLSAFWVWSCVSFETVGGFHGGCGCCVRRDHA